MLLDMIQTQVQNKVPGCRNDRTLIIPLPHQNTMPQIQDAMSKPRTSIQTQGQPGVVLSIDVERRTGNHNYPLNVLDLTRPRHNFPATNDLKQNILSWWH